MEHDHYGLPEKPLNLCRSCGRDFGGVNAFDRHRVGKHEYLYDDEHPDGRRCLTEDEMLPTGLRRRADGRWGQDSDGLQERLGSSVEATHVSGSTT